MNGDFNIADGHLTDGHLLDVRTNTSLACPDFNVMRSDRLDRTRATMEVSYFKIFTTFRSRITRRPWRDDLCFHWSWPLCPFKSFPLTLRFSNGSVLWKMKMALPSQRWKWPCPLKDENGLALSDGFPGLPLCVDHEYPPCGWQRSKRSKWHYSWEQAQAQSALGNPWPVKLLTCCSLFLHRAQ